MVQKRSFYEEMYHIPCKHPRQMEYNNELISLSEYVPRELVSPRFHASGESGLTENTVEYHEKLANEIDGRLPITAGKDVEDYVPGRSLNSSSNIGFNEEASHQQKPVYIPCCPEYFSPEHPYSTLAHHDDMYSLLLRNPPRKAVPVGSDYQAELPEWRARDNKLKVKLSGAPGSVQDAHSISHNDEDRLMGTCVIPMPALEYVNELENVKIECCCLDEGSIRCVRKHVVEARDKLERIMGKEKFEELGFGVMGEQVAKKWSEAEEELFYEVVFSKPMSLGKNFWNCLSAVFPSRTKMDIVSYYFNVFMLRRRAEQNRFKSKGIYDSDDDEWQGSDDSGDNELEFAEDDVDSVVESPLHLDDCAHIQGMKNNVCTCGRCNADDTYDDTAERDISDSSATHPKISFGSYGISPDCDRRHNREVQDDSCMMSDRGVSLQGTRVKADSDTHWSCSYNGVSYGSSQDHDFVTCNVKLWDVGYIECPKIDADLLSTCSMIEEVFGGGSLNYKARDEKSVS